MRIHIHRLFLTILGLLIIFLYSKTAFSQADFSQVKVPVKDAALLEQIIKPQIGSQDALLLVTPDGQMILGINEKKPLIPASILKILTSMVALEFLGKDFRFKTKFYQTPDNNLIIKGYGDPLLISECIQMIAKKLSKKITHINDLVLDDTYFNKKIIIPGQGLTNQPYDSPNGALCVNFNTVYFKTVNDKPVSAESQTPLVPFAIKKIKSSGLSSGRMSLTKNSRESLHYAGELFHFFLKKSGIQINGQIRPGRVNIQKDKIIFEYESIFSLEDIVTRLLDHSNNFMANQLLLTVGAKMHGPPATMAKGIKTLTNYLTGSFKIKAFNFVEGSGISRKNRISAHAMAKMLIKFQPNYRLMRRKGREFYKTGTLYNVKTRAGYIFDIHDNPYIFVLMLNTPGKSTSHIMHTIEKFIQKK